MFGTKEPGNARLPLETRDETLKNLEWLLASDYFARYLIIDGDRQAIYPGLQVLQWNQPRKCHLLTVE